MAHGTLKKKDFSGNMGNDVMVRVGLGLWLGRGTALCMGGCSTVNILQHKPPWRRYSL